MEHDRGSPDNSSKGMASSSGYFCRGCGRSLPAGSRSLFHEECLAEDKRRRVREQRQQQHEQFTRWLRQQACLKCGARCGQPEVSQKHRVKLHQTVGVQLLRVPTKGALIRRRAHIHCQIAN